MSIGRSDRFFREERGHLERAADADAHDDRRARVRAGAVDRVDDELV